MGILERSSHLRVPVGYTVLKHFQLSKAKLKYTNIKYVQKSCYWPRHRPCHLWFRTGPLSRRCHFSWSSTHFFKADSSTSRPPKSSLPCRNSWWAGGRTTTSGTDASVCGVLTAFVANEDAIIGFWHCSAGPTLQGLVACRANGLLWIKKFLQSLQVHDVESASDCIINDGDVGALSRGTVRSKLRKYLTIHRERVLEITK